MCEITPDAGLRAAATALPRRTRRALVRAAAEQRDRYVDPRSDDQDEALAHFYAELSALVAEVDDAEVATLRAMADDLAGTARLEH